MKCDVSVLWFMLVKEKKLKSGYTYTNKICIYLTSNFGVLYQDKIHFTTDISTTLYITPFYVTEMTLKG